MPGSAAALFGERALPIAGAGTPAVAEFAVMELAAVLDLSHEAALALVGDVLDLAHRLPRLWAWCGSCGSRSGWAAKPRGSPATWTRSRPGMRTGCWPGGRGGLNPHRVGVLVHEARLYADPDRAIADHDRAMDARRVEVPLRPGCAGHR